MMLNIYQHSGNCQLVWSFSHRNFLTFDTTFAQAVFGDWCGKSCYVGYVIRPADQQFHQIVNWPTGGHAWAGLHDNYPRDKSNKEI
jgi:hypothetical protein